uniref:Uncharacterized protein n=1 Tax=Arundo donax TaxID=35708 RepID=A0A0A8YLZ7_ARUDO
MSLKYFTSFKCLIMITTPKMVTRGK